MSEAEAEMESDGGFACPFGPDFGGLLSGGCVEVGRRRPRCETCRKAQSVCICGRFRAVVENRTRVTILQHPLEKDHPVGSARVAELGLRNVSVVTVPELGWLVPYRLRPRVPGSKRSAYGSGGWKQGFTVLAEESESPGSQERLGWCDRRLSLDAMLERLEAGEREEVSRESLYIDNQRLCGLPLVGVDVPPGLGLLYPSDRATDMEGAFGIRHLIVLDATWAKAKRMYHENPWLQSMPHFRLPAKCPSLYEGVRRQPKPGCLSTLESIVYALQAIEPETLGLPQLLHVFDSMVEDHRMHQLHRLLEQEKS